METRICERCGNEYSRSEKEIIVYPNLCRTCDVYLSNVEIFKGKIGVKK